MHEGKVLHLMLCVHGSLPSAAHWNVLVPNSPCLIRARRRRPGTQWLYLCHHAVVRLNTLPCLHTPLHIRCHCVQALMATSLYLGRHAVVGAFTGAAEVVAEAARIMPVVVVCICADGVNSLLSGVLRGCGRQAWGAGLNLVGYW